MSRHIRPPLDLRDRSAQRIAGACPVVDRVEREQGEQLVDHDADASCDASLLLQGIDKAVDEARLFVPAYEAGGVPESALVLTYEGENGRRGGLVFHRVPEGISV